MNPVRDTTLVVLQDVPLTKPETNFSFSWKDISLSIPVGKEVRQVLHSVSGSIRSGEVIAIMGGSGAGKSTLLNALAGRIGTGELSGSVLINGAPRNPSSWTQQYAYVEQDSLMFSSQTVFETLFCAAKLLLPLSMSKEQKVDRVNKIIDQLGLQDCRDTEVGGAAVRGISGGERKRLSIGVELIKNPSLLFLDEPTSGLDSFNAFNVIETIQKQAKDNGKMVLLSIHQPRAELLTFFDKILLLSQGRTLWFGTTDDAIAHFEKLGYPFPVHTNPADYFLDYITLDQRTKEKRLESIARIENFGSEYEKVKTVDFPSTQKFENESVSSRSSSSWFNEYAILFHRGVQHQFRDKETCIAAFGEALITLLILSGMFARVPSDSTGVQNRTGGIFFLCINIIFISILPVMQAFADEKLIITRERAAGAYNASSAYVAKQTSLLPRSLLTFSCLLVPIYWIYGLQPSASKFFTYLAICLSQIISCQAIGLLVSASVPNAMVGQAVAPLIVVIFMLCGGLLVNINTITPAIRWLQWISPFTYANKALIQNEFSGLLLGCQNGVCSIKGENVIKDLALETPSIWYCVMWNVVLAVGFSTIGCIVFAITTRPIMRLKQD